MFATGVSAIPIRPRIPGLDDFKGEVLHSGAYTNGAEWKGRKAIVVGTGNSGHDVAQDLCASGADVTIVQRSPTYIVSIREAQKVYAIYTEGLPFADCDLLAAASPYAVMRKAYQLSTAEMRNVDRDLLAGLEKRGFRLTFGEDDTGFQMMYLRRGGGYYFNVGCSDMIVDGRIKLLQYDAIEKFEAGGARLKDGTLREAELVVVATGYENQQETVRHYMGDAIADRIGKVWGFDAGGELANMWRPTAQPGLWFTAGSLAQCRIYSRYLALQIKAREDGLLGRGSPDPLRSRAGLKTSVPARLPTPAASLRRDHPVPLARGRLHGIPAELVAPVAVAGLVVDISLVRTDIGQRLTLAGRRIDPPAPALQDVAGLVLVAAVAVGILLLGLAAFALRPLPVLPRLILFLLVLLLGRAVALDAIGREAAGRGILVGELRIAQRAALREVLLVLGVAIRVLHRALDDIGGSCLHLAIELLAALPLLAQHGAVVGSDVVAVVIDLSGGLRRPACRHGNRQKGKARPRRAPQRPKGIGPTSPRSSVDGCYHGGRRLVSCRRGDGIIPASRPKSIPVRRLRRGFR